MAQPEPLCALSAGISMRFCGRTFSSPEIALMRQIAAACAGLGVTEIARTICEVLAWKRPSGGLKNHECRQLLERLAERGWLRLPAVRALGPRRPRRVPLSAVSNPEPELTGTVSQYELLQLAGMGAPAETVGCGAS